MPRVRFLIVHETLFWDQEKSSDPRAPPSRRKELAAVAWMMECLQTLMVTHETYQRRVASKVNHVAGDLKNCAQHPSFLVQTRAKPDDNDETVTLLLHCKFIDETKRINPSSHPHLTLMYPPMYHPYRNLSGSFVWGHFTCKEPFRCKWSTIVCWSVRSNDTQEDDDILDAVVVDVWISSFFGNFTVVFGT